MMGDKIQSYASIGLIAGGVISMTAGADVAPDGPLGGLLAVCGGLAVFVGGVWGFRLSELRGDFDERYFQITLRGAAFSLWGFYWTVVAWSQLSDNADIATPVLDPLTWLLFVPWAVFAVSYWYYTRVM